VSSKSVADWIELDTPGRTLTLNVSDDELASRRVGCPRPSRRGPGCARLYDEHVLQADQGADPDFLVGASGADVPRHNH
jgi:dihydroxy-acid dehydratase